jgi:hypothetical protein
MPRTRLLVLGLLPAAPLVAAACSEAPVPIGLVMIAPQAVQDAETVDLFVFKAGKTQCLDNGTLSTPIAENATTFPLSKTGCDDGLAWCGEVQVERTEDPTVFAAIAKAQGQTILQGCTITPVNQDPLEVEIEMQQFLEPPCCGDGKLQPGEQCDPGGLTACGEVPADEVCFPNCTTAEVLLSTAGTVKPLLTNETRTKSELAMAFCPGNAQIGTALRTLFRSKDSKAAGGSDINLRVMSTDGYTIVSPQPLGLQMRLPMPCWDPYDTASPGVEQSPAIAPVSQNATLMVYESNIKLMSSSDVFLIVHTEDVCADVPLGEDPPIQLSKTESTPGATQPDVARGPEGQALIVWNQKGQVVGRLWKEGVLTPDLAAAPLTIGTGSKPKVAGNADGWVVVYQAGSEGSEDILKRSVKLDSTLGGEETVNGNPGGAQTSPDVAMLDNGTHVVVWESGGDIFFQRFTADGRVSGDQDAPLNDDKTEDPAIVQASPAVGAPGTGGRFFAAAWENSDGTVSARYLGDTSGFLFNSHDGRSNAFPASHLGITGERHKPAVAIGTHVVFGWQDDSDVHPGMYIRRFPLPK